MDDLAIRGDGRTDIQAWDGSRGAEPPASKYTAARLVTQHVGAVPRACALGSLAASIDASGLAIVRSFDDPRRILFSCRLREERGTGIGLFGPEDAPWLFAAWRSGMALFERSGEGFELREELSFAADASVGAVILEGGVIYVGMADEHAISIGRAAAGPGGKPALSFPTGSIPLPEWAYSAWFAVGPRGEIACVSADDHRLLVVEGDGTVRWARSFPNMIGGSQLAFRPDGAALAVCDGPCVRELDAATGRDLAAVPAFEDLRHRPVKLLYAGNDTLAVGTYQSVVLLERLRDGGLSTKLDTDWIVPGQFDSICRSGSRFLFFFESTIVSCVDGERPHAGSLDSSSAGILINLAFRGSTLRIGDGSGRERSIDLGSLSAEVGPRRERRDIFSAPGWTDWGLAFYRCRGRSYTLWSNSLEEEGGGSSIEFRDRLLRCAAFSEERGLAAVGDIDGKVSIYRCDEGLGEELCSFEAPGDAGGREVSNLLFASKGKEGYLVCVMRRGAVVRYSLGDRGTIVGRRLAVQAAKQSETDFAAINTIFAVEGGFGFCMQHTKRSVQFFSIDDLSELHPSLCLDSTGTSAAVLSGTLLAGSAGGKIFEFPLSSLEGPPKRSKALALGSVRGIAASDDGRLLAVGGVDYRVHIIDRASWDELAVIHLFDREMIVATPPTEEDKAKGREFHAFYDPLRPDPTDDPRIAFYHSKGQEIRAGTGTRLDPSKAEDRSRIAEYLETLFGTEAVASGDYGRKMVLDAILRPKRAMAALGGSGAGGGTPVAGLIEGGES
jgi:hypothetical protein